MGRLDCELDWTQTQTMLLASDKWTAAVELLEVHRPSIGLKL
jgi:hypothetical protein